MPTDVVTVRSVHVDDTIFDRVWTISGVIVFLNCV